MWAFSQGGCVAHKPSPDAGQKAAFIRAAAQEIDPSELLLGATFGEGELTVVKRGEWRKRNGATMQVAGATCKVKQK